MAYRRSLSIRATLFARRLNPSIGCISHHNDRDKLEEESLPRSQSKLDSCLVQQRSFGECMNSSTWKSNIGSYGRKVGSPFLPGSGHGIFLGRYMSTSRVGEGLDKSGFVTDVATTLSDSPVEAITSQVPGVSEVAIAAADSALPVAALQYLIDGVHTFTGTNWWISIALTTLLIRVITIPLVINQLKASAKLAIMKPRLEAIKDEMQATGMDPQAVAEGQKRMKVIFNEYGVTPFTPLKGLLIQGPIFISFFFAISNMVEKVPSFKTGGAFWFTDLTTPDSMYIFPVLTGLTFLATSEGERIGVNMMAATWRHHHGLSLDMSLFTLLPSFNMQEGLEGNPMSGTMKKFTWVVAVATVPLTMTFAKGIFCYWITSNLYSLAYGSAIRVPGVKKFLGVPDIPVPPPSTTTKSQSSEGFSFLGALKQFSSAAQKGISSSSSSSSTVSSVSPSHEKQYKLLEQKPSPSSAGVSHRIASLERKVKQRKRGGKKK